MTTRDVALGHADGWVAVVPLGTFAFVHNVSDHTLRYKFGIGGTSRGIPISKGGHIKIDEVVYIKDSTSLKARLVIIGD